MIIIIITPKMTKKKYDTVKPLYSSQFTLSTDLLPRIDHVGNQDCCRQAISAMEVLLQHIC